MLITNVSGTFDMYKATMYSDAADFSDMQIQFEAEVTSINTRNDHRDDHLRSNDFFDAVNNPTLKFESTGIRRKEGNIYDLNGKIVVNSNLDYGIQSIDVSNLSSGIYLVNFRNSEGKSSNKKIVKK
jgi:hypothetical protein